MQITLRGSINESSGKTLVHLFPMIPAIDNRV